MANKSVKYLNGLAIVSIVFILISGIPLGILTGLAISTGGSYSSQDVTVQAGSSDIHKLAANYDTRIFLIYWISGDTSDFQVYVMTDTEYINWKYTNNTIPTDTNTLTTLIKVIA